MKIEATRVTAALTGVWSALGFSVLATFENARAIDVTTHNVLFLSFSVVFFFVPGWLFVIGERSQPPELRDIITKPFWSELGSTWLRMLCWFGAASCAGVLYSLIEKLF